MTCDPMYRRIRQMLKTDALMGMDALPILSTPVEAGDPAEEPPRSEAPGPPEAAGRPKAPSPAPPSPPPPALPGLSGPVMEPLPNMKMTAEEKAAALAALDRDQVRGCTRCGLCAGRTNTVFGEGDADADLMFIGEGPGEDEDAQGRPFVGRAGQLLDRQIAAMGLERQQVYIANIVKCRPPGNRAPSTDEAATCIEYLHRQIEIIQPKVIVALGATAVKYLLNDERIRITRLRGQWQTFRGVDLMPTFHPAYLLRQYTPENRKRVWSDLQAAMEKLGI